MILNLKVELELSL